MADPQERAKAASANYAVNHFIKSNQLVSIGTGSTAAWVIKSLAESLKEGRVKNVRCVCTSTDTERKAAAHGIPFIEMDDILSKQSLARLDVAIDGADEVSSDKNLIKGRGGALFREKFIEEKAKHLVIVVDHTKLVNELGTKHALPVEIVRDNHEVTIQMIKLLCEDLREYCAPKLRLTADGGSYVTDNGLYIVDLYFVKPIKNPILLNERLCEIVGVFETGFFLGMAPTVVVGQEDGTTMILD